MLLSTSIQASFKPLSKMFCSLSLQCSFYICWSFFPPHHTPLYLTYPSIPLPPLYTSPTLPYLSHPSIPYPPFHTSPTPLYLTHPSIPHPPLYTSPIPPYFTHSSKPHPPNPYLIHFSIPPTYPSLLTHPPSPTSPSSLKRSLSKPLPT